MQKVELKINKGSFAFNEAYKALRTNILFCGADIRVIAMTSCVPGEGKSSVSFNIAKSLAEDGKKVIFVDADLRRSVVASRYKIGQKAMGLSHCLSGQSSLEEVIFDTNVENLHVIFAGVEPPNPSELLGGKIFEECIAEFRKQYDYVIIDTPPMGSVADCSIVSKVCDGIILIVEAGSTKMKLAKNIAKQLEKTGCKILGAVLNKVDTSKKSYYSGYYGGGYYSYKRYSRYYNDDKDGIETVE